jgi:hypothetical protein
VLREKRVWGIEVHDARFKTADGLGVSSTLGQIRERHSAKLEVGEGSVVAGVDDLGMSFDFSAFYPSVEVPSTARAQSIWIWSQLAR